MFDFGFVIFVIKCIVTFTKIEKEYLIINTLAFNKQTHANNRFKL